MSTTKVVARATGPGRTYIVSENKQQQRQRHNVSGRRVVVTIDSQRSPFLWRLPLRRVRYLVPLHVVMRFDKRQQHRPMGNNGRTDRSSRTNQTPCLLLHPLTELDVPWTGQRAHEVRALLVTERIAARTTRQGGRRDSGTSWTARVTVGIDDGGDGQQCQQEDKEDRRLKKLRHDKRRN